MTPKIQVAGVSKWFRRNKQDVQVLQKTHLTVPEGQFVTIIGPSGCGKSTLFNVIAGLMIPSMGRVYLDEKDITGKPGFVGYMLQKDMLLPWRTIIDNIILGMEIRGMARKEAVARALPLMEKYGLGGFEHHYPRELSGGMRQRAALLRTLLYDRDVMLLDEPFGALDAQTRLAMQNWLLRIWSDFGKTVLFVTHDIDEALYLSDEIYVFSARPGRIKEKVEVSLARPRTKEDMTSGHFMTLKYHLLNLLASEFKTDGEREPAARYS